MTKGVPHLEGAPMQRTGDDCVRCCLAVVMDKDYEGVPDFVEEHGSQWFFAMVEWVQAEGYKCFQFVPDAGSTLRHSHMFSPGATWIASGPGPRGRKHAVVYRGNRLIHDPHESGDGICEILVATVVTR